MSEDDGEIVVVFLSSPLSNTPVSAEDIISIKGDSFRSHRQSLFTRDSSYRHPLGRLTRQTWRTEYDRPTRAHVYTTSPTPRRTKRTLLTGIGSTLRKSNSLKLQVWVYKLVGHIGLQSRHKPQQQYGEDYWGVHLVFDRQRTPLLSRDTVSTCGVKWRLSLKKRSV